MWVRTFGVAQLMHKEEQGDVAWTTSLMHIHEPLAQVTRAIQCRSRREPGRFGSVDKDLNPARPIRSDPSLLVAEAGCKAEDLFPFFSTEPVKLCQVGRGFFQASVLWYLQFIGPNSKFDCSQYKLTADFCPVPQSDVTRKPVCCPSRAARSENVYFLVENVF